VHPDVLINPMKHTQSDFPRKTNIKIHSHTDAALGENASRSLDNLRL